MAKGTLEELGYLTPELGRNIPGHYIVGPLTLQIHIELVIATVKGIVEVHLCRGNKIYMIFATTG